MAYNLVPWHREQGYLMPPSLREWLAGGHLAWFIVDAVVGQIDLREFYGVYRDDGWGAAAYGPGMMVAVLLYAYCQGTRSSQRIAWALEPLFVQVLGLCRGAGLVKLGVVAVDGTRVAANAALAANRSYETIQQEVRRMLEEARAVDADEDVLCGPDRRGEGLPEGLGRRAERLKRLQETKARLEREAEEGAKTARERLTQRQAEEDATGEKKRGRKPAMVEPTPWKGPRPIPPMPTAAS